MDYTVSVEGLPGAEVLFQDVTLGSNQTITLPLIVRLPQDEGLQRTMPMEVRVFSPDGELRVPTTFKSGAAIGVGGVAW